MMRSSKILTLLTALVLITAAAVQVDAQQGRPGGRGRGGFPGGGFQGPGGGGKLGLLRMDAVKKELELLDEQAADIEKLAEELRSRDAGNRPDFRNLSDEERRAAFEKLRAEREALSEAERAKQDEQRRAQQLAQQQEADAKLAEILLPHQMDRLSQIELQTQGIRALTSDEVVKELGLSDKAKADVEAVLQASGEKMRALFQGGNREGIREKMEALRKEIENDALAKLTQSQRDKFAEMKGEPFEMPQGGFGRGGRGGGGGGGGGGGRPQRPAAQ